MTTQTKALPSIKLLAVYGGMFLSAALGLLAYLSLRNTLHIALVRFDVYLFSWRAIDIGVALAAMVGILILSVVDVYTYRKAAVNGRLIRPLSIQCGILAGAALLLYLLQFALI